MGIISSFFLVDDVAAFVDLLDSDRPSKSIIECPQLDMKGFEEGWFISLEFVVEGKSFDPWKKYLRETKKYAPVYEDSCNGPWVQKVPESLIRKMAELDKRKLPRISKAWMSPQLEEPDLWSRRLYGHSTLATLLRKVACVQ